MQGKFTVLQRNLEKEVVSYLKKGYSILLLGPRQVGKTTLITEILKDRKNKIIYSLVDPQVRLKFQRDPGLLIREVLAYKKKPLVFIDEVQRVPELLDSVQYLIDNRRATFILTGSSARKLKRKGVNLLPGRIIVFYLTPLMWNELGLASKGEVLEVPKVSNRINIYLEDILVFGSLPKIALTEEEKEKSRLLSSYTQIYLEEEIRAEALARNIGGFSRFLEVAALESGTAPNFTKISQQSGVAVSSVREFYQLLEDTLVVHRLDPYLKSPRKRIFSSPRYYFFDIGVRNSLANLPLKPALIRLQKGILFEHFVILEIFRRKSLSNENFKMYYWRTYSGLEVDCVLERDGELVGLEIKASRDVSSKDARALKVFLEEHKEAKEGYVIFMGERPQRLAENILALPWHYL